MTIAIALPTKNRPNDLVAAVDSILVQRRRPDELIVVDQSPTDESRRLVEARIGLNSTIRLTYIHDQAIAGLVPAKRVAAELSGSDILCFLEDDVVLEPDYLAEMETGFLQRADMLGCCGVVTNLPPLPPFYGSLFHLFHRGIYRDPRVGIHGCFEGGGHALIPSRALSGGLSAWRREVFDAIPFDVANDFFMLEDIDFSTRAEANFGPRFYINPNARLAHNMSPLNRARLGERQRRKLREYLMFYKKRSATPGALPNLLWLLPGLLLEAMMQTLSCRSLAPLKGYAAGLRDGIRRKLVGPM
jgi:glycosyltransferase involved in cell wall biosynthesis